MIAPALQVTTPVRRLASLVSPRTDRQGARSQWRPADRRREIATENLGRWPGFTHQHADASRRFRPEAPAILVPYYGGCLSTSRPFELVRRRAARYRSWYPGANPRARDRYPIGNRSSDYRGLSRMQQTTGMRPASARRCRTPIDCSPIDSFVRKNSCLRQDQGTLGESPWLGPSAGLGRSCLPPSAP